MLRFIPLLAGTLLLAITINSPAANESSRPNILIILADDLGYSDVGCFGGEIDTPNIDALAANGLRFTQFYNNTRCCPSRASLLTGLYPHQTGMGHMMFDRNLPGYHGDLNNRCVTIAEVLGGAGYRTYAIGKWHLSRFDQPTSPQHSWPLQRGFEKYYGLIWGYSSFFDPAIVRGNQWFSRENDPEYKSDNFYFTNALTDNAVTFLQQHAKDTPEKPFFLYQAYTAAHWPMHAMEKDIAKYKGRFDAGYDKLRQARIKRQRELGLLKLEWEPTPTAENWDNVKNREWELRRMEVYAAMIDNMDQGIGKIVAELQRQGQLENTLILFLQDNGGCAETRGSKATPPPPSGSLRALKPDELPGGTIPKQTREGLPVRSGPAVMPGGPDTYIAYGQGWANVSNTPFREYKHWTHEGGIATPLIVQWPRGIEASRRNSLTTTPAHLIDIMATCVDVAGTSYPAEHKGISIPPMEGVSLLPLISDSAAVERAQPLFWEHEGNRAVRDGRWKLVAMEDKPWELYDMEADRTEMHDLAAVQPDRVKTMAAQWDAWAARCDVLPLGGWKQKEAPVGPLPSRVELKQGEELSGSKSPAVGDRDVTITVSIESPQGDGVLASQGGRLEGYSLYVQNGKVVFALRRGGNLAKLETAEPLGDAGTTLTATLSRNGNTVLLKDGRPMSLPKQLGALTKTPAQGLSAGFDSEDPTSDYEAPFKYPGMLGNVTVESADPNSP